MIQKLDLDIAGDTGRRATWSLSEAAASTQMRCASTNAIVQEGKPVSASWGISGAPEAPSRLKEVHLFVVVRHKLEARLNAPAFGPDMVGKVVVMRQAQC